jgi:hypothetical protein
MTLQLVSLTSIQSTSSFTLTHILETDGGGWKPDIPTATTGDSWAPVASAGGNDGFAPENVSKHADNGCRMCVPSSAPSLISFLLTVV